ncbi:MAG: hypothetical protein Q8L47_04810, partial [bacterium]|nr:hypothetical protein [bacterium]
MNRSRSFASIVVIGIIVLVVAMGVGYFIFTKESGGIKVFESKDQCEREAGSKCIYYLCDIPLGDIFQKICTQGDGSGWYNVIQIGASDASTASTTSTTSTFSAIDTSDWKTYRNEEYGFGLRDIEFKYPKKWEVELDPMGYIITFSKTDADAFRIYESVGEGIQRHPFQDNEDCKETEMLVDFRKALKMECQSIEGTFFVVIAIKTSRPYSTIYFELSGPSKSDYGEYYKISDREGALQKFNQILSSFKFIQLNSTIKSSNISLTAYIPKTFTIAPTIKQGSSVLLNWISDDVSKKWGDKIFICLIGLDDQKEEIKLRDSKVSCYPDTQFTIGTSTLSLGKYEWLVNDYSNKYVTAPSA